MIQTISLSRTTALVASDGARMALHPFSDEVPGFLDI
jgi:hypothetical protein